MWSGSARAKVLAHPSLVIVMADFLTDYLFLYQHYKTISLSSISEQPLLCEASGDRPSVWHKTLCRGGRCSRCVYEMLGIF